MLVFDVGHHQRSHDSVLKNRVQLSDSNSFDQPEDLKPLVDTLEHCPQGKKCYKVTHKSAFQVVGAYLLQRFIITITLLIKILQEEVHDYFKAKDALQHEKHPIIGSTNFWKAIDVVVRIHEGCNQADDQFDDGPSLEGGSCSS